MESGDDHHASILSIVSSIESINDEIFVLLPQHVFITPTLYDIKTKTNNTMTPMNQLSGATR